MTVGVYVVDGIVQDGAPIVRKFIGQPAKNLERWMSKQGEFRWAVLERVTS